MELIDFQGKRNGTFKELWLWLGFSDNVGWLTHYLQHNQEYVNVWTISDFYICTPFSSYF